MVQKLKGRKENLNKMNLESQEIEKISLEIRDNLKDCLRKNVKFTYTIGELNLVFDPKDNDLKISRADLNQPASSTPSQIATMSNDYFKLEEAIAKNIYRVKINKS